MTDPYILSEDGLPTHERQRQALEAIHTWRTYATGTIRDELRWTLKDDMGANMEARFCGIALDQMNRAELMALVRFAMSKAMDTMPGVVRRPAKGSSAPGP